MASPATPGLFLCFAACVLLVFVCVSSPTWEAISFLNVNIGGRIVHFGVFGYTGSDVSIGYDITQAPGLSRLSDTNLTSTTINNLTKVLILHPIAAGLAGLSVLFGICGAAYHRSGTIIMTLLAALATLVTLVIFVIDMVLFGIARNRLRDNGIPAQYGNANWLVLGALVALFLGFCAGLCGTFGSYRRRRDAY